MKTLIVILSLLTGNQLWGQRNQNLGIITANVMDSSSGKPLAGATTRLKLLADSGFSRVITTGTDGNFEFTDLPFGYYRLIITSVGFTPFVLDSISLRSERFDFNLGDLKMVSGTNDIQTVVVFAEKPLIENKDGKITYNVGESALSAGSNTAELLRNMPMVSNDPNGKLLLKGKEPKILIDDKPVELSAQQLTDLLESLPGGSIERIELMQNPPPQYASEQGGVINIVTKKGKVGTTGKISISSGTRKEGTLAGNINYRGSKLTIAANLSVGGGLIEGTNRSERNNFYADSTNQFKTANGYLNSSLRPNIRLQMDYDVNKHHQWSLVLQGNSNYFDNESHATYLNINRYETVWKKSQRDNHTNGNSFNVNPQLSYRYRGKNPAEVLQVIATGGYGGNVYGKDFYQVFLNPGTNEKYSDSTQSQRTDNAAVNLSVRINYTKPTKIKGFTLSTGGFINNASNNNALQTYFFDKINQQQNLNPALSSELKFSQQVFALRIGANLDLLKTGWKFVAGLQAEETAFQFKFKTAAGNNDNSYLSWLPTVTLRKDFNKTFNSSFVYRKSIRRPGMNELNPAVDYGDPYNLRFGNPFLLPSLSHNFDFNLSFSKGKSYLNGSVGFNKVTDIINSLRSLQSDGKTVVTYKNIASRKEYEAGIWGGYTFSRKFRMNLSTGYSYNSYSAADRLVFKYRNGGTFNATVNYNIIFSTLFSLDGNFRYSSFADAQGTAKSNISSNFGVQYKMFKRRLIVAGNIIDPFTTGQLTTITQGSNFRLENFNSNRTRNFRISVSWVISSNSKKTNKSVTNGIKKQMAK